MVTVDRAIATSIFRMIVVIVDIILALSTPIQEGEYYSENKYNCNDWSDDSSNRSA